MRLLPKIKYVKRKEEFRLLFNDGEIDLDGKPSKFFFINLIFFFLKVKF
jgi:hypothetical protein